MDLLTAIGSCSVAKDFPLVFAMVIAFSQGQVLTVKDAAEVDGPRYGSDEGLSDESFVDNATAEPPRQPSSVTEALATVARLQAAGGAPLLGLLPVPPRWAQQFGRDTRELFEPCVNISIASAMVSQFEYECGRKPERACVLERYALAAEVEGFDEIVLETIADHDMPSERRVALETDEVFSTPIYAPDSARTWGADKIFFTTAPSEQAPTRKRKALAAKRPD